MVGLGHRTDTLDASSEIILPGLDERVPTPMPIAKDSESCGMVRGFGCRRRDAVGRRWGRGGGRKEWLGGGLGNWSWRGVGEWV